MNNLLIVESPKKIPTLKEFLNDFDKKNKWEVIATVGHIREMHGKGYGFDPKTLTPTWQIIGSTKSKSKKLISDHTQIVEDLYAKAKHAHKIYIATDADREGEAIGWHVLQVLPDSDKKKCRRITFNEITEDALKESLNNIREIDQDLVNAYFARTIIDRKIGFDLSKLVKIKLHGISAGRVQSVGLKFIYDRELERNKFKHAHYFTLKTFLKDEKSSFEVKLRILDEKLKNIKLFDYEKMTGKKRSGDEVLFSDEEYAKKTIDSLGPKFTIYKIDSPRKLVFSPPKPMTTSTLIQRAVSKFGWSTKQIHTVCQVLHEGVNIGGKHKSIITYPRTDSTRYSKTFINLCQKYVTDNLGKEYFGENPENFTNNKATGKIQDGHEAIHVVDPFFDPHTAKKYLKDQEYKMYSLIWHHSISSLMANAVGESIAIRIENNGNKFYTHNSKIIFYGYRKIYSYLGDKEELEDQENINIKTIKEGDSFKLKSIDIVKKELEPPPYLNQGTLVKICEETGVGRPSTYNSIASVVLDRGYCLKEQNGFRVTELGQEVITNLEKYFPNFITPNFTAEMETHLDHIAEGEEKWKEWIFKIFPLFEKEKKVGYEKIHHQIKYVEGRMCPKCGARLVYRHSRFNNKEFIGCENYPICDFVEYHADTGEKLHKHKLLDELCPLCGKQLIERFSSKTNIPFIGCSGFPKCHYIRPFNMSDKEHNEYVKIRDEAKKQHKKPTFPPHLQKLLDENKDARKKAAAKEKKFEEKHEQEN